MPQHQRLVGSLFGHHWLSVVISSQWVEYSPVTSVLISGRNAVPSVMVSRRNITLPVVASGKAIAPLIVLSGRDEASLLVLVGVLWTCYWWSVGGM